MLTQEDLILRIGQPQSYRALLDRALRPLLPLHFERRLKRLCRILLPLGDPLLVGRDLGRVLELSQAGISAVKRQLHRYADLAGDSVAILLHLEACNRLHLDRPELRNIRFSLSANYV